ncbi:MAG: 16S rRNA (guanine(527)-N(7))-methyltransferase RsmG [Oscillospiraceae bacterium]
MDEMTFLSAKQLFARYDIPLSAAQFDQFSAYAGLLSMESPVQNITRVNHLDEIWTRHFLDSAYLLRYFHESSGKTLLDLGTGGGFPGIPLAIMCPSLTVTLLDSEERKLEFCQKVVNQLNLSAICLCGRAEELSLKPEYREQFDYVASRAVANGSMLCELAVPFLKVNGTFFSFKGSGYDPAVERFAEASSAMNACPPQTEKYILEGVEKYLVMICKSEPTPLQFPRRFAKIKRSPL